MTSEACRICGDGMLGIGYTCTGCGRVGESLDIYDRHRSVCMDRDRLAAEVERLRKIVDPFYESMVGYSEGTPLEVVTRLRATVDRQARHITILVMDQRRQLPADVLKDIADSHHERDKALAALERARAAARAYVAHVDNLGAFADDSDPRVMAVADPLGKAQADLWLALGLNADEEAARLQADIASRCAVCGWTLADSIDKGCIRGNCSLRPRPEKLYAPERAAKEAKP